MQRSRRWSDQRRRNGGRAEHVGRRRRRRLWHTPQRHEASRAAILDIEALLRRGARRGAQDARLPRGGPCQSCRRADKGYRPRVKPPACQEAKTTSADVAPFRRHLYPGGDFQGKRRVRDALQDDEGAPPPPDSRRRPAAWQHRLVFLPSGSRSHQPPSSPQCAQTIHTPRHTREHAVLSIPQPRAKTFSASACAPSPAPPTAPSSPFGTSSSTSPSAARSFSQSAQRSGATPPDSPCHPPARTPLASASPPSLPKSDRSHHTGAAAPSPKPPPSPPPPPPLPLPPPAARPVSSPRRASASSAWASPTRRWASSSLTERSARPPSTSEGRAEAPALPLPLIPCALVLMVFGFQLSSLARRTSSCRAVWAPGTWLDCCVRICPCPRAGPDGPRDPPRRPRRLVPVGLPPALPRAARRPLSPGLPLPPACGAPDGGRTVPAGERKVRGAERAPPGARRVRTRGGWVGEGRIRPAGGLGSKNAWRSRGCET